MPTEKKGFTLLELLIVIAIIAVLAGAILVIINPIEMLKKSRDSKRVSDLSSLREAIGLYISETSNPQLDGDSNQDLCSNHIWYSMVFKANNGCPNEKECIYPTSSQSATKINGTGWIPISLETISFGSPISNLPLDPKNEPPYYYTYACNEENLSFEIDAKFESYAYATSSNLCAKDGGNDPNIYEVGISGGNNESNLTLLPSSGYSFYEEYQSANIWNNPTDPADMPDYRYALATVVLNGKIYAIGGINNNGAVSTTLVYTPATNSWSYAANMHTPRQYLGAAAVNGKIYAFGGATEGGSHTSLSSVEEYDPSTNIWTYKSNMLHGNEAFGTAVVNGKVYLMGGYSGSPGYWNQIYHPSTDTWTTGTDPLHVTRYPAAITLNGKIYLIGGWANDPVKFNQVYNPETDTWQEKAPIAEDYGRYGAAIATVNGKIYLIGGHGLGWSARNAEYNPQTNSWTQKPFLPGSGRGYLAGVNLNEKIYILGGSGPSARNDLYIP